MPIADLKKRICGNISFVVWDFLFATLILQTENIRWFSREKNVSQLNWRSRVRHSQPHQHDRKQFKKIMRRQKSIKHIRTQTHSVLTAAHLFNGKLTNNNNIIRVQTSIKLLLLFGWLAGRLFSTAVRHFRNILGIKNHDQMHVLLLMLMLMWCLNLFSLPLLVLGLLFFFYRCWPVWVSVVQFSLISIRCTANAPSLRYTLKEQRSFVDKLFVFICTVWAMQEVHIWLLLLPLDSHSPLNFVFILLIIMCSMNVVWWIYKIIHSGLHRFNFEP